VDGASRRERLERARLYLILEARPHGQSPASLLSAALDGGVDIVQLRDKNLRDAELVAAAEPFRELCRAHGALFVLNDRPDLVEASGADGVHLGQFDTPLAEARALAGSQRIVGLSATTAEELDGGNPDYWGVGAIFGTPTKPDSLPGDLGLVRAAVQRLTVPWFAIGGIELGNVAEVVAAGAPGVAVVRAIRDADDPHAAALELRAALDRQE
jgi:thiamine-phosphate pyrophosphorylase